jgi:hypothetical protein
VVDSLRSRPDNLTSTKRESEKYTVVGSVGIRVLIVRIRAASADAFHERFRRRFRFTRSRSIQCNVWLPPPRRPKRQGVLPERNSKSFLAHSPIVRLRPHCCSQGDTDTSLAGKTFVTEGQYFYHAKLESEVSS